MSTSGSGRHSAIDASLIDRPLSRRGLLQRSAALAGLSVVPVFLSACGGDDESGGGDSTKVGGTVNYLGWEGEDNAKALKAFTAQNDITLKSAYIASMSDIPPKFAAGGGKGVDIVDFSAPAIVRLQQSGVKLQALDTGRIPNWKNVEKFISYTGKDAYSSLDGSTIVAAPISWGALGITYDSAVVSEPKAWGDLLKPEFKGKLTTVDDPSTNVVLAARILGFDSARLNRQQLDQIRAYLERVVRNCKKISPSFGDMANLLASGEVAACFGGWSAINNFALQAGKKTIKTNLAPEEGSALFASIWTIAEQAKNTASIYAMINELLDPKVNAAAADALVSGATVEGAVELQDKAVTALFPAAEDYASYFQQSKLFLEPPAQSDEFVTFGDATELWTQIKAGA